MQGSAKKCKKFALPPSALSHCTYLPRVTWLHLLGATLVPSGSNAALHTCMLHVTYAIPNSVSYTVVPSLTHHTIPTKGSGVLVPLYPRVPLGRCMAALAFPTCLTHVVAEG